MFVNENGRHGARAPLNKEYANPFKIGTEQLTPSGMRQHYLLGGYMRFMMEEGVLPEEYNPDHIFVKSTPVDRTIQSAMSQMIGLYPLGSAKLLTEGQAKAAVPHIDVQNLDQI